MNAQNPTEPSMDPRLRELLKLLHEVPPRDPDDESQARARYMAEIDSLFEGEGLRLSAKKQNYAPNPNSHKQWTLPIFRKRLAFTYLMAIITMLVVFFGGAGVTAYASQAALPGDALYPVKTGLELTQVSLSRDAARQAQLYMNFAERRLDEIASLVAQGRFDDVDQAALDFESNVQRAINTLNTVAAGDPVQAQALATQISNALMRYTNILKGMLTTVPDPVKPALEKAIQFSETEATGEIEFEGTIDSITPEGWIISGRLVKSSPQTEIKGILQVGMMVKVHVLVNEDGTFIAQEIEPRETSGDIETNENNSEGMTDDNEDNSDGSANENEDDDEEDLENLNTNENHNVNSNQNENTGNDNDGDDDEDDNSNQNGNDNQGNENNNDNDDDDDDVNGNQNDNDDDSSDNDNDNDDDENSNNNDND